MCPCPATYYETKHEIHSPNTCVNAHMHSWEKGRRLDICPKGDAECSGKFTAKKNRITQFSVCTFLSLL